MELKEFIESSLIDIMEGIENAQKHLKEKNSTAVINATKDLDVFGNVNEETVSNRRRVQNIDLDIAVIAESSTDKGGSVGVKIKVLEYNKGKKTENTSSTTSRVKFSIPVIYPC